MCGICSCLYLYVHVCVIFVLVCSCVCVCSDCSYLCICVFMFVGEVCMYQNIHVEVRGQPWVSALDFYLEIKSLFIAAYT